MMESISVYLISWALGSLGALMTLMIGIWWKVEHRQDQKIDNLAYMNGKEHRELHDKIEANHHAIRDRLDQIWKHMHENGPT